MKPLTYDQVDNKFLEYIPKLKVSNEGLVISRSIMKALVDSINENQSPEQDDIESAHDKIVTLSISDREKICKGLTFKAIQPDLTKFADFIYSCFCSKGNYGGRRKRVNPEQRKYIRIRINHGFGLGYVFPLSKDQWFDRVFNYFDTPRLDTCEYSKLNDMLSEIKELQNSGVNSETRVNCVAVRSSCDTRELFYNCPAGYIIWLEGSIL